MPAPEVTREKEDSMEEIIYTVFPSDASAALPQDFTLYADAKEYGDSTLGPGNYEIECPCD